MCEYIYSHLKIISPNYRNIFVILCHGNDLLFLFSAFAISILLLEKSFCSHEYTSRQKRTNTRIKKDKRLGPAKTK